MADFTTIAQSQRKVFRRKTDDFPGQKIPHTSHIPSSSYVILYKTIQQRQKSKRGGPFVCARTRAVQKNIEWYRASKQHNATQRNADQRKKPTSLGEQRQ